MSICKGCFEYELDGQPSWCPEIPEKGDSQCPCLTCLVKTLECDEACERWDIYNEQKTM